MVPWNLTEKDIGVIKRVFRSNSWDRMGLGRSVKVITVGSELRDLENRHQLRSETGKSPDFPCKQ